MNLLFITLGSILGYLVAGYVAFRVQMLFFRPQWRDTATHSYYSPRMEWSIKFGPSDYKVSEFLNWHLLIWPVMMFFATFLGVGNSFSAVCSWIDRGHLIPARFKQPPIDSSKLLK